MTDEPELVPIADGVHAWIQPDGSWYVNNTGAIVGDDGVVLVDTCATRQRTERFLAAVAAASGDAPVRLAVNTHLHGDHTYGNAVLPDSTVIVGHEKMREGLLADTILRSTPAIWEPMPDWGVTTIRPPTVVLRDSLTLFAGTRRIEVLHPGYTAHTPGDSIVWLPEERVLFSGDLIFHAVTPLIMMGSLDGALRSLDWIASFEPTVVVPGHGALIDSAALPDVLLQIERYYRFVGDVAEYARAEGKTPLQAADRDLGEFADWPDSERIVPNLHRAYADAAGTPFDVTAAMADAVAWHGGPLRCTA